MSPLKKESFESKNLLKAKNPKSKYGSYSDGSASTVWYPDESSSGSSTGTNDGTGSENDTDCPVGYIYSAGTGSCEVLSCPEGYTFNGTTNSCVASITCRTGYTYNPATFSCEKDESETGGVIQPITEPDCGEGYYLDTASNTCRVIKITGAHFFDLASITAISTFTIAAIMQ